MNESLLIALRNYRAHLRASGRLGEKEEIWVSYFCDGTSAIMCETWVFISWKHCSQVVIEADLVSICKGN